jgi:hypothetical protein
VKGPELNCQKEFRREEVRNKPLNGLDYLEVVVRQNQQDKIESCIKVYFLGEAPEEIGLENILIEGGQRIRGIKAVKLDIVRRTYPEFDDHINITLDRQGDFSIYTLRLVDALDGKPTNQPLTGFDPRFSSLEFSFMAGCPSDLDCKPLDVIPLPQPEDLEVDYLVRDYSGFRQTILDRLSLIMPDWKERHVPDLGIALVEVLAYAGDYLSYYQDAVATEAYLDTARRRVSVRRHARLVDYRLHEGCNARTWIHLNVDKDLPDKGLLDKDLPFSNRAIYLKDLYFITRPSSSLIAGPGIINEEDLKGAPSGSYEVFQPLDDENYSLRESDIDPIGMAVRLRDPMNELSKFIKRQLSADARRMLDSYKKAEFSPEKFQAALAEDLNKLIEGGYIYDQELFKGVEFRKKTSELIGKNLSDEDLPCFNRLLLEDAYSEEIEKKGTLHLYKSHNTIHIYTWGERECCLPRGATSATLVDEWDEDDLDPSEGFSAKPSEIEAAIGKDKSQSQPKITPSQQSKSRILKLRAGDLLLFEEVLGPRTSKSEDADRSRRHVVLLVKVTPLIDPVFERLLVDVEWSQEDALPFSFCISALGKPPECSLIEKISVARGNIILSDHGQTYSEALGEVQPKAATLSCINEGVPGETNVEAEAMRPHLHRGPLTFSQPIKGDLPASKLLGQDPRLALPWIELDSSRKEGFEPVSERGTDSEHSSDATYMPRILEDKWTSVLDLLESNSLDRHFVVEMDNDGLAQLRFGDGELGRMPEAGTGFTASYRVGNGPAGNIGQDMITNVVFRNVRLIGANVLPRNPLPAVGGTPPEKIEDAKLLAPHAFRKELQRAITADDYARLAEQHSGVQRAAATIRGTGSWQEVMIAIDPLGAVEADQELLDDIEQFLHKYSRMGHEIVIRAAQYVSLDVELTICILPDYLRGHVEAELLDLLSNRALSDGRLGFFHPDNLTFGQGVYLSRLVAAVQAVKGVECVKVDKFQRLFEDPNHEIESGVLTMRPLEIARLDNDPNFPENGALVLNIIGGR